MVGLHFLHTSKGSTVPSLEAEEVWVHATLEISILCHKFRRRHEVVVEHPTSSAVPQTHSPYPTIRPD